MTIHPSIHTMLITRYSNQQGSKWRQRSSCQVQLPDNIGNLSASRRCPWVGTTVYTAVSGVLPVFQNLNCKLQRRLSDVLPIHQQREASKVTQNIFLATYQRVTRRHVLRHFTSNGTNQYLTDFIELPYSITRATPMDSDCYHLPTASVLSNKADKSPCNQF